MKKQISTERTGQLLKLVWTMSWPNRSQLYTTFTSFWGNPKQKEKKTLDLTENIYIWILHFSLFTRQRKWIWLKKSSSPVFSGQGAGRSWFTFSNSFLNSGLRELLRYLLEVDCFSKRIPPPRHWLCVFTCYKLLLRFHLQTHFWPPFPPLFPSLVVQDQGTKTSNNFVNEDLYMCSPPTHTHEWTLAVQVRKKLSFYFHKTMSLAKILLVDKTLRTFDKSYFFVCYFFQVANCCCFLQSLVPRQTLTLAKTQIADGQDFFCFLNKTWIINQIGNVFWVSPRKSVYVTLNATCFRNRWCLSGFNQRSTSEVFQHKKLKITLSISKTKKTGLLSVKFVKRDCQLSIP